MSAVLLDVTQEPNKICQDGFDEAPPTRKTSNVNGICSAGIVAAI